MPCAGLTSLALALPCLLLRGAVAFSCLLCPAAAQVSQSVLLPIGRLYFQIFLVFLLGHTDFLSLDSSICQALACIPSEGMGL